MSVADAELQADDIEDLTSIAAPATPSIPVDMTPPPLPASAGLPPVAPSRLIALAEPRDPNTDATSPLPPATQDAEAASPAASSPTVTGARAEAGAAPEQPSPSASGTKPATAAVPANAPEAPSTPTPSRAKSAGRGLALVAVLAAVGVGVFFALPKKEATETPRVQGVAPAQNQSPEGAASSNPGETAPSGAESPDAQAPERNDDASAASPEKTTAERADPLLVAEAELGGCAPLLAGFEPRMVDPVQEASLAWKEAREQIVKGDLVAVERKMCEAVQLHPQSAALEGLAMLYLNQRAPRRALTYLEKAEAVRPGETETLNLRGDIHSQLGEGEQALSAWLRALKLDAGDAARRRMAALEYANQGQGQFRRGALPQAERWFRRAAALDPTNVVALVGLAEVFLKTERLPSAAALARQTLTVSELQPQAHVVLGDVARAAGDTAEARASYERALAVRSDHWPAKARLRELAAGQ
jgi:tetratricopeptide (TPR) repeat protein